MEAKETSKGKDQRAGHNHYRQVVTICVESAQTDMEAIVNHNNGGNGAPYHCMEQEHDEVLVIVQADAISDPGAVMVHTKHTSSAHRAVMSSRGPN